MHSHRGGDELTPLIVSLNDEVRPRNYVRDIHILSSAFLFIFSAYCSAQNLESTLNAEEDLGKISLGILYVSLTLFSFVASPIVRVLGSKRALVVGTSGYLLFIASHLKPFWYTMIPASVYNGFTSSLIWVGQGTYLTSVARFHAKDHHLHEGTVIGDFNGQFWGIVGCCQVFGNLISLVFLMNGKGPDGITGKNPLFIIFVGITVIGVVLMCFLSNEDEKGPDILVPTSLGSVLNSIISPLFDIRMLLLVPLLAYSGLQQAFVWAEFTNLVVSPVLGVSGIGGAMAVYGTAGAVCSLVVGRFTSGVSSITLIVSGGSFLQIVALLWLLFGYSVTSGILAYVCPILMAAMWGVGNAVFNAQLNALLGILFKREMEAAFAQLKVWQSSGIAFVFFVSPYITLQAMLILMVAALTISISGFLFLTLRVEKSHSALS